jgi:hypothetical protein
MIRHVDTIITKCPHCGTTIECATHFGDAFAFPRAGDVAVCWGCQNVNLYSDNIGHLRKCTDEELVEISKDPELERLIVAMRIYKARA